MMDKNAGFQPGEEATQCCACDNPLAEDGVTASAETPAADVSQETFAAECLNTESNMTLEDLAAATPMDPDYAEGISLGEFGDIIPAAPEFEDGLAVAACPGTVVTVKPRTNVFLIILAVIGGLALAAILAVAVLYGLGIDLRPRSNDILCKDNYSVTDQVATDKKDDVIATVGDKQLTNGGLQVFYWETVYSYINNNYSYLTMYGLDITKPLNEQPFFGDPTKTWQQFFLETALSSWQRYTTLQVLAQDAQFQPDEEMQALLDGLNDNILQTATSAGYDNVEAWLADNCGPGCSEKGYMDYVRSYYESTAYLVSRYDALMPKADEVEAYFAENESIFTQNGVTKEGKYYDVRHILIGIEGGTKQEDGTMVYTDAEWETCRTAAQAVLDEYLAGDMTEDAFAQLAMLHSVDGGSSTNGGLYTDLTTETNFVPEFKEWYLDPARVPGDTGLVKTTYGYHIMYFSASRDIWYTAASEQLLADRVNEMIEEGMEQYPMKTNYRKIVLGTKETL